MLDEVEVGMVNLKYRLRVAPWATLLSSVNKVLAAVKVAQTAASLENSHLTWFAPFAPESVQMLESSEKLVDFKSKLAGPVVTSTVWMSSVPEGVVSLVAPNAKVPKGVMPSVVMEIATAASPKEVSKK